MKFQIGDKVVVLHSNEEGEVIDIINDKMVMVEIRGVKFPAYNDQLDFPYFKRFTEKKLFPSTDAPDQEKKKAKTYIDQVPRDKVTRSTKQASGVWLMFIPKFGTDEFGDEVVDLLKIHLVNGTDKGYNFDYTVNFLNQPEFELKNQVFNNQDFYLHDVLFEKFNDSPTFHGEFSLISPDKKKADYYETVLKLRPKQVFTKIEELKAKNEPSFSFKLFDDYPDKPLEETISSGKMNTGLQKPYEASKVRQHLEAPRHAIDLHMEKITDDWKSLSNFEILSLQLQHFEKYYDLAVAHRQPSLIVIHGLGSGRLRDEVHELLRHKKEVKTFINQYHASYGYGATEIYFQY
ncbi:MAG: Smr/MutS family protein [Chitinophagaceae bacterium]